MNNISNCSNLDAYEISNLLYNNKFDNINVDITVNNHDLKTYFEMCIIITVEGFKFFFSDKNNIVNIETLSLEDFNKINKYLNKLHINMTLKIFNKEDFEKQNFINYENLIINNNTKLEEFNFIIKKNNIYVINYNYIYNNK